MSLLMQSPLEQVVRLPLPNEGLALPAYVISIEWGQIQEERA
jgi:hypothetical protein